MCVFILKSFLRETVSLTRVRIQICSYPTKVTKELTSTQAMRRWPRNKGYKISYWGEFIRRYKYLFIVT